MFVRSTILHADLDAFYASVEQRDDPRLRNRPVAVGGGVILAASYEAKRRGVTTPMGGRQARALCPGLIIVRPRFDAYVEASKAVFELFRQTTPLVQGVSIDEAFLDVGGLHQIDVPPVDIAARLRAQVRDVVGLPITVGVARTPFLAKVASRVAKPDGLLLVLPADEESFLHPLPVEMLWGVGAVTAAKLHAYGLRTAGDVALLPQSVLVGALGPAGGRHLYAVVHGHTPAKVVVGGSRGSIGAQRALGHGPHDQAFVRAALLGLVDRVCRRMRKADRIARTVVLRLRFEDYTKATRSRSFARRHGLVRGHRRRRGGTAGGGRAADPRARDHAGGRRADGPVVGPSSCSSPCPSTTPTTAGSTRRSTRSRCGSARRP